MAPLLLGLLALGTISAQASRTVNPFGNISLDDWIRQEKPVAEQRLMANISPGDGAAGAVLASPQRDNPNYYFHWVRDAALVMDVVRQEAALAPGSAWDNALHSYAKFSRANQLSQAITGLGEPKFMVTGEPFMGPWGRPQNDGPALRALTFTRWARWLLEHNGSAFVKSELFTSGSDASLVKADLRYVADHWQDPSFDLWEEVKADHFFTRLSQWAALTEGAALADRLGDVDAAFLYRTQAQRIGDSLELFWNRGAGQIDSSRNYREGVNYKTSQIDVSVLLAVLHARSGTLFPVQDPRVAATFERMLAAFAPIYAINRRSEIPGTAVGRYPEDRYGGTDFNGGNPWVLCTLAVAEYYYRLAALQRSVDLRSYGDQFLARVKYHANPDGSLSEQMDRETGFMTSARDLSWNYAALLNAAWARESASRVLRK